MSKKVKSPMYGKHHTKEAKRKMSEAHKGKHLSGDTRQKLSEINKGKIFSEETIQKMKESSTEYWQDERSQKHRKKLSEVHKGKTFSEETRRKLRENHWTKNYWTKKSPFLGGNQKEETKKKISETKLGQKQTKEHSENIRKAKRGNGLFGFTGAVYKFKNRDPSMKVWQSYIRYNKRRNSLGYFNDPLSCQIVYDLVLEEISRI